MLGEKIVAQENVNGAMVPTVTLGSYKGLKVKKNVQLVTELAIETELQRILDQNSQKLEISHRATESGDIATIDFEGFVDDVAFEGGKGEDVDLEIGSGSFIPGFEEQLIGKKAGEEFDINVNFPEGYGGPDLSGKPAVFKTKVKNISSKSAPEANDEFASKTAGVPSMAEFRALIRNKLEANADASAQQGMLDDILNQIIDNSTFELSDELVDSEANNMLAEYRQQLQSRGIVLEQYIEMMGQTMEQFVSGMREPAIVRAKSTLIIKAIAALESIAVTDEDLESEYNEIARMYKIPLEDLKSRFREEDHIYIQTVITTKKVFDLLITSSEVE